jgi:hypothetical protein
VTDWYPGSRFLGVGWLEQVALAGDDATTTSPKLSTNMTTIFSARSCLGFGMAYALLQSRSRGPFPAAVAPSLNPTDQGRTIV